MELNEIIAKIADIRYQVSDISDACFNLHKETNNPHVESVSDYLCYELTNIATRLADLEETETSEDFTPDEGDDLQYYEEIHEWWEDLGLSVKCELANIPYPSADSGRGDEQIYAEDRANKWWDSRTLDQKRDIYEENKPWWDKEDEE